MITPLGFDQKTWEQRHKVTLKTYKKFSSWRKGYRSGKENESKSDNPYLKKLDHSLMKKAALWYLGWEHAAFNNDFKRKRMKKFKKEESKRKHKEEKLAERKAEKAKIRKDKKKHKHHRKHK